MSYFSHFIDLVLNLISVFCLQASSGYQSLHVRLLQWNLLHSAVSASGPHQDPSADSAEQRAAGVSESSSMHVRRRARTH